VLPFLGVARNLFDGTPCLISPWMKNGHIMDFMASSVVSKDETIQLLFEIADGLTYLHSVNVVYGDLRPPNILIDDQRRVRLADFGLANFADSTPASVSTGYQGIGAFTAPEFLDPDSDQLILPSKASDIFAFAMCLFEISTKQPPFKGLPCLIALKIFQGKRPEKPAVLLDETADDVLQKLIESCWHQHPASRPSVIEVQAILADLRASAALTPPVPQLHLSSSTAEPYTPVESSTTAGPSSAAQTNQTQWRAFHPYKRGVKPVDSKYSKGWMERKANASYSSVGH